MSANAGEKGRGSSAPYQLGGFDGRTFRPRADACWRLMDHGRDFYAAATSPIPKQRGSMALPRELFLVEEDDQLRLGQRVVSELGGRENQELALDLTGSHEAHGSEIPVAHPLVIDADVPDGAVLTITLAADQNHGTTLTYNGSDRTLGLDRHLSSFADIDPTFSSTSTSAVATVELLDLDIYVGATSVEVFAAGGTAAITDCILPNDGARAVRVHADGDAVIRNPPSSR